MAVSGTTTTYPWDTARVIEHAFRRCRMLPERITPEMAATAMETLDLFLASIVNRGVQLWATETVLVPTPQDTPGIAMPAGTMDVLSVLSRGFSPVTSTGASGGTYFEETATGGDVPVTMASLTFSAPTTCALTFAPVVSGVPGAACLTVASTAYAAGVVYWFQFDRSVTSTVFRATNTSGGSLPLSDMTLTTNTTDIPIAAVTRQDYENLPNKYFSGRPLQYWMDLQRDVPTLWVWPVASSAWANYPLVVRRRRYLMDTVGMQGNIDIPKSWYDAIVWQLAWRVAKESPEIDPNLIPDLKSDAADALALAMRGQADRSPTRFSANIGAYTR